MDLRPPAVGHWAEPPENNAIGLGQTSRFIPHGREEIRSAMAAYYGLINHIDDMLHNLLARVNLCGQPTYVLFCSDHGEQLGDHYLFRKSQPYQGSVHIPFLLKGPEIPERSVIDEVVCLEDILPTFCDLAGIGIPDHVEGRSLVPLLRGDASGWRSCVHGEQGDSAMEPFHYLTDGAIKYIWFSRSGREQLFDLKNDPREIDDLANDPAWREVRERWRARLVEQLKDHPEGFVVEGKLVAGRPHPEVLPHALPV